jgi:hypothetical protein
MVTEEIEDLEEAGRYLTEDGTDALMLLQAVLLPGELLRLARRFEQARASGKQILVGVEFTRGHARKIIYHESELLERE